MNPALLAVAAQQQDASDALLKRLVDAGATHPSRAIAFVPADDAERDLLVAWQEQGVVRQNGKGLYYADLEEQAANNARIGYGLLVAMLVVVSIAASTIALLKLA